jgi:SAM-dependent methyltransferase
MDVIRRELPPAAWEDGEKIPWHEARFSERMLEEHLTQGHDMASRRFGKIDEQVAWIHGELLSGRATRILDLGCGPGLYTNRLASLGHECVGIDYAPASIAYARQCARKAGLRCTYVRDDIRRAKLGGGFGLVMLIFGEFNVFRLDEAKHILAAAHSALDGGGLFLLEPQTLAAVEKQGNSGTSWRTQRAGLFCDRPHLSLEENFWHADTKTATWRTFIIDATTSQVTRHAASTQAYTHDEYGLLLREASFEDIRLLPSLTGKADESQGGLLAIVAGKPSAAA